MLKNGQKDNYFDEVFLKKIKNNRSKYFINRKNVDASDSVENSINQILGTEKVIKQCHSSKLLNYVSSVFYLYR